MLPSVSELIPSLRALLAELPDTDAGRDAAQLAAVAGTAAAWEDTDLLLDSVVQGWELP
jgi:hypothetical protein